MGAVDTEHHNMLSVHDKQRLEGVRDDIVAAVSATLEEMAGRGFPMFVAQGGRTTAYQQALFLQGRPGGPAGSRIVTDKDGVTSKSNHQMQGDGHYHAVDCAFLPTAGLRDAWDPKWPWDEFGEVAESHGLTWGGRWKHPVDLDHVEMV